MGPWHSGAAVRVTRTKKPFVKLGASPCWLGYWRLLMKTCSFQWWGPCKNAHQRYPSHSALSVCPLPIILFFLACFPCMNTGLGVCTCVLAVVWKHVCRCTCLCVYNRPESEVLLDCFPLCFLRKCFLLNPEAHRFDLSNQLTCPGNPVSWVLQLQADICALLAFNWALVIEALSPCLCEPSYQPTFSFFG